MGFFDFFKRKEKPKRLEPPKILMYDGKGRTIEYDPNANWKNKTEQQKQDQIKLYTLDDKVLINMEIPSKDDSKITELNLIQYETRHDNVNDNSGKGIKDMIVKILDCQSSVVTEKERYKMVLDAWVNLESLLRSKTKNAELSSEGKAILKNFNGSKVSAYRTIELERDENGYLQNNIIKDDLKLIKKVISLDKEHNFENSSTQISVPTKKLSEQRYRESDLADFLKGYIALCRLGNTIGIGTRVIPWEYGASDEAYKVFSKTDLGKDIEDITKTSSMQTIRGRVRREILDKSMFLENMIEQYIYKSSPENGGIQNHGSNNTERILQSIQSNPEDVKLVTTMLEYSKTEITQRLMNNRQDEAENGINYQDYTIEDLVRLTACMNHEEIRSKLTDEQLVIIHNGAKAELKRRADLKREINAENKENIKKIVVDAKDGEQL